MLAELCPRLSSANVVLASSSPRRKTILAYLGLSYDIVPSTFEENLDKSQYCGRPFDYVTDNAKFKAIDVAQRLRNENSGVDLIISCDTVVTLDGIIIEKPKDRTDAVSMLRKLSGRTHTVYSGVCLATNIAREDSQSLALFHVATDVTFADLSADLIKAYVDSGDPMDKAGGYGIQGAGAILIREIKGDYYNVVGLPLQRLAEEILKLFS